ncbi:MAG: DNA replication/repair protein RecF [Rhodothermales bacterium]|nr:DNA replication/repair protein RecF [Rhodothermales bacterium]
MRLHHLRLRSFRAHAETELTFAPGVNLLYGPNGAGKTNVLEAVHYLCLTKSFLTSQDTHALRQGCPFFEVEGQFEGEGRPELAARLVYVPNEGKRLFLNKAPLERLADVVGTLPVVVFHPEDYQLTAGGPDERRRFLDNTLSQARPVYLDDLLKYRRALKQRNALLLMLRRRQPVDPAGLEAWTEELVVLGARIIERRRQFLGTFAGFLHEAYRQIEAVGEEPSMTYQTAVPLEKGMTEADVADAFHERLHRVARKERERGRTLAGPHRDELVFRLGDFEVRPFASQGQHRTFGMALKLAKYFFLQERLDETPLFLLDDVFGDLDPHRAEVFLRLLQSDAVGQSLITAARRDPFAGTVAFEVPEHKAFLVVNGSVTEASKEGVA